MNRVEYLQRTKDVALEEEIEKAKRHAEWITEGGGGYGIGGGGGGEGGGGGGAEEELSTPSPPATLPTQCATNKVPFQSTKATDGDVRASTLAPGASASSVKGPRWVPRAGRGVDVDGIDRAYNDLISR